MKIRNIIITVVLSFLVIMVLSLIWEINSIENKAREANIMLRSAGDMALQQTQLIDEYMSYGNGASNKRGVYETNMPSASGNGFVKADIFEAYFGLNSNTSRDAIFNRLYGTADMHTVAAKADVMKRPIRYFNPAKTGFQWYYMPRLAAVGLDLLPETGYLATGTGSVAASSVSAEAMDMYDFHSHIKQTWSNGEYMEYYNTPINTGVTYINKDFLAYTFMNNMDLLMRGKYKGVDLNSTLGGNGILHGQTYGYNVVDDLNMYNPINNGSFTLLRGERNNPVTAGVFAHKGVLPDIEYKVIDMYDSANDSALMSVFGANKEGYPTKAAYLKSLDEDVRDPLTGMPYTKKPFVLAKVTFYADVIIPYSSVIVREFASLFQTDSNYLDLKGNGGMGNTRRMSYTTYFAVTP